VATAANFVNLMAPSVSIGETAVFLEDARRQNHPTGQMKVVVSTILFNYMAFRILGGKGKNLLRRNRPKARSEGQ
jgi:hypothetical protein